LELLQAEQKARESAAAGAADAAQQMTAKERFDYLLSQSDVFAHFLAGSVAASSKKGKKGSRGKSGRKTEEEEDAELVKLAQSKRRTVRLEKQPGILAPTCTMHKYQLEGLNWLIKLHDSGINGILADEVCTGTLVPHHLSLLFGRKLCLTNLNIISFRWDSEKPCNQSLFWRGFVRAVESVDLTLSLVSLLILRKRTGIYLPLVPQFPHLKYKPESII